MYSCAGPEPRGRSQARPFLACCDSVLAPASPHPQEAKRPGQEREVGHLHQGEEGEKQQEAKPSGKPIRMARQGELLPGSSTHTIGGVAYIYI